MAGLSDSLTAERPAACVTLQTREMGVSSGMGAAAAVVVGVAVLGVLLVLYAWKLPPFASGVQTTDNAYVRGQVTLISPQVSGYVTDVPVQDFQMVRQGQLLAQVDDRIYRQRLEQAEANLHSAEAALSNSTQTQASARGSVAQQRASLFPVVTLGAGADRAGGVPQQAVDHRPCLGTGIGERDVDRARCHRGGHQPRAHDSDTSTFGSVEPRGQPREDPQRG